jgi:hypothetical protein
MMVSKRRDLDRVRNAVEVRCSIEMGTDGRQMQAQPTRQRWRCGSVSHHEDAGHDGSDKEGSRQYQSIDHRRIGFPWTLRAATNKFGSWSCCGQGRDQVVGWAGMDYKQLPWISAESINRPPTHWVPLDIASGY